VIESLKVSKGLLLMRFELQLIELILIKSPIGN
jgi:hypothetical protein